MSKALSTKSLSMVLQVGSRFFQMHLTGEEPTLVVGGRHFWLFALAGGPPYVLCTYLIHNLYTLRIYMTIYIFGGPPAMSKTRLPTTMIVTHPCDVHLRNVVFNTRFHYFRDTLTLRNSYLKLKQMKLTGWANWYSGSNILLMHLQRKRWCQIGWYQCFYFPN